MSEKAKITINGITGEVEAGKTILEAASEIGAGLAHICFGNALCSTCRVEVIEGADGLSTKEMKEKVSLNYHLCFSEDVRLACQCKLNAGAQVVCKSPFPFNVVRPPDRKDKTKEV